ncbi:MAG: hypothetical protein LC674_05360, partial [Actinobacteria bacterium]|nr:hypothetical protein [Actinomycetota bacterium]
MMRVWLSVLCVSAILLVSVAAPASTGDLSGIIEGFMAKQFPDARSHFWVVNGTQWQAENEVVVDVNTVVVKQSDQPPREDRFLLLVVEGQLAATQN